MPIDPNALERLNRDDLIAKARQLGAQRAELLTRPELRDEIIRLSAGSEDERRRARGWFGVARDLVASVVSQGLNLPDTADLIRGVNVLNPKVTAPVATVTLAEIYAAQGHVQKALDLLDEVLAKEPDHDAARRARERWAPQSQPDEQPAQDTMRPEPHQAGLDEQSPENDVNFAEDANSSIAASAEPTMPPSAFESEIVAAHPGQPATDAGEGSPASTENGIGIGPEIGVGAEAALAAQTATEADVSDPAEAVPGAQRSEPVSDQLVVLHDVDGALLCDWELTQSTIDRLRLEEPTGLLTLRTVEVVASWDGPLVHQREFELDQTIGQRSIAPHGSSTAQRAVLGWRTAHRFIVVALGAEFRWSRAEGAELLWAPPHSMTTEAWQHLGGAAAERMALGAG